MLKILAGLLVALLCAPSAFAQEVDTTAWITNGQVNALVRSGNTVYLGGTFTRIGPNTGSSATLNTGNGQPTAVSVAKTTGIVRTAIPDGRGGWFVGGEPSIVGGLSRKGLAHILPNGNVDGAWEASIGGYDAAVRALVLAGDVLYVGGFFESISGQTRNNLAALDARTGKVTDWSPQPNATVHTLAISGNTIYAGGNFTAINGEAHAYLAAIDAATGVPGDWGPAPNAAVTHLHIWGSTVYVAGSFTSVASEARNGLAAVDAPTGMLSAWNPSPAGNVNTMTLSGNTVYVAGDFTTIAGQVRDGLAAFDAATGQITSWRPEVAGSISTLAVAGKVVLLGGEIYDETDLIIDERRRRFLVAVDATTGSTTVWRTLVDGYIYALSVMGSTVYVGGRFSSLGLRYRRGLAAINATTGVATDWNPTPKKVATDQVQCLAVAGGRVYVGGNFTTIGGKPRRNLASLDAATGEATPWAPDPNNSVHAMAVAGNVLYLGGYFTATSGQTRYRLAAYDLPTGQLSGWKANVDEKNNSCCSISIAALAVSKGIVYAAGGMTSVNGQPRSRLAALDGITGKVMPWNPGPFSGGNVYALAVSDQSVYAGGDFVLGGQKPRRYAGAFDVITGAVSDWNPEVNGNVYALAVSGDLVYVGGRYGLANGQPLYHLAAFDASRGVPVPWNSGVIVSPVGRVATLGAYDGTLYAGGSIEYVQGDYRPGFAVFRPSPAPLGAVKGTVYKDAGGDCVRNAEDKPVAGRVVVAQPGNYYSITDSTGSYTIRVDTGRYTVSQLLPNDLAYFTRVICPANPSGHPVHVMQYGSIVTGKDFANQTDLKPHLSIGVSSNRRRRCFTGTTVVSYCNEGMAPALNVQVHVQLPGYVALVRAGQPYAKDREGNYVFTIGTLAAGGCGTIQLVDSVVCNNPDIRGLTQCTKAWITPANNKILNPQWDRSDITLKARCGNNGRVRLALYNTGARGMADSSAYRIYLDAQLAFTRNYKLAQGDSLVLHVPAHGRTVRLEADQRPAHPDKRQSNITVEACGTNSGGKVSKGYVCQFPQDDEEPEVAIECLPIIDSFDPNDKAVSPEGVTDQHYTPTGRALEYVVRFQNTGTDVAYKVVVVDTLSEHLDVSTLRVGAVSHPYKLHVSGKGRPVLTFTFDNINLPDSNANEPASHGRIQFSIKPKADLPEKTRVENFADIFFDYNEPVRTNTTVNTLYDLPPVVAVAVALAPSDVCPAVNTVAIAGADRVVCAQDTVGLRAVQPSEGNGRWRLVKGAGTLSETNRPDASVTGLAYGENVFEWRIPASRCSTDSVAVSVAVTRLQKPVPVITQLGADQLVCSVAGSRYEWFRDGVKLDGPGQQIQVTAPGRYTVRVETPEGCRSDLSEAFAYGVTGLVTGTTAAVRVFPNPTPGRLVIDVPLAQAGPVHVRVVDNLGRTVLAQTFRHAGQAGAFRAELDLSAQAGGLYVLKLQTGGGLIVRSVFKK
jgi:uncharacterized repeat protein (TIGR01451 family)